MPDAGLPDLVRFGPFELDLSAGDLQRNGRKVRLPEQQFQILQMLLFREGGVVSREEIRKRLWPNDTVVEFDRSINAAIMKLRSALGDTADKPSFIETVARRGYRLMVPVQLNKNKSPEAPAAVITQGALIGQKVSHYRVLGVLGGGGMGLVYKAEDLKLNRPVALKFLPDELATDSVTLQRFEREARTASSLNHPNICTIYEVEEHETQPFIVMELLEGETLREVISKSAASASGESRCLPLRQLLDLAVQIAEGLDAAHQKDIIHRDIKPANIFVTTRGQVKILDFGLAKVAKAATETPPDDPGEEDVRASETGIPYESPTEHSLTRTGLAMGTAGYMSPEQVRGEKLDARTDLFSFGLILFEMATGTRAFSGDTAAVIQNAILNRALPPAKELNPEVPDSLEKIIRKALEKDREARYQTATEMCSDLKRLNRDIELATHTSQAHAEGASITQPRRYGWGLWIGASLAVILLAFALGFRWFKGRQIAPAKRLSERLLTHNTAENSLMSAAISPDGKYMAYVDPKGLHLTVIESGEFHDVPLPEELRTNLLDVTWSPDGEKLILTAQSNVAGYVIWVTSVFGGAPRKLRDDGQWPVASPQDSSIAFISRHRHEIWVMGADGENPHRILASENEFYAGLAWSPTGRRLAYIKGGSQDGGSIETVSLEGGPPSVVVSDPRLRANDIPGLIWTRDGRMIFDSQGSWPNGANLWEIMADPRTGKPSGRATKVTSWDGVVPYSATISRDATRLAVLKGQLRDDVYVGELKDGGMRMASPTRLTVSESNDYPSGWMHDSKTILLWSNRTGRDQIFRQQLEQDVTEPLIPGADDENYAEMSPDGRWILYWSSPHAAAGSATTTNHLMRLPVSGGLPEQVLEARIDATTGFHCPSRPVGSCIFSHWDKGQLIFYELDPIQGQGQELARTKLGLMTELSWTTSPDGLRIAVATRDQLPEQVRVLDSRSGAERNLQLPHGWRIFDMGWTADGSALFTAARTNVFFIARIDLDGKTHVLLDQGRIHVLSFPRPSPDSRHLAFSQRSRETNAWLLENF